MTKFFCSEPVVRKATEQIEAVYVAIGELGISSSQKKFVIVPEPETAFEINTRLRKHYDDGKLGELVEGIFEFDITIKEVQEILDKEKIDHDPVFDAFLQESLDDLLEN